MTLVLTGAHIRLYLNNTLYKSVQGISFDIDYNEYEVRGIDVGYAQEIAPGQITVRGTVRGLRLKMSGGLQGSNLRPLFTDIAFAPYISIRIEDRQSGEDILFIQNAKISKEHHEISTKSTYKISFDFIGQIPLFALDRA